MNVSVYPIRTKADYRRGLREVEDLMEQNPRLGTIAAARLEVLGVLVEAYEKEHFPMPPADPIEVIRFYLGQRGKTVSHLVGVLGTRARVSEIMNGVRPLTLTMIRRLRDELGVPVDSLIA